MKSGKSILADLVGFDTTSHLSNLQCIDYIESFLLDLGFRSQRIFDASKKKANLLASFGPENQPGILLSGHTDVVPANDKEWKSDPFKLEEREGRLFARGTSDMKGFLANMLEVAQEIPKMKMRKPLHFAFTYDEEVGCLGARRLAKGFETFAAMPEMAFIGEPTDMNVVRAHKGMRAFKTKLDGKAAHSSAPDLGTSAIQIAALVTQRLYEIQDELKQETRNDFDPPFSTLNVGRIQGGTAMNVIAPKCELTWEYRVLPGQDETRIKHMIDSYIQSEILGRFPDVKIAHEELFLVAPFEQAETSSPIKTILSLPESGRLQTAPYTTEAGIISQEGIPAAVCGPGSLQQAHKANEHITLEMFEKGTRFVRSLIELCVEQ